MFSWVKPSTGPMNELAPVFLFWPSHNPKSVCARSFRTLLKPSVGPAGSNNSRMAFMACFALDPASFLVSARGEVGHTPSTQSVVSSSRAKHPLKGSFGQLSAGGQL